MRRTRLLTLLIVVSALWWDGQALAQDGRCITLWDIALVARGMAEEGAPQPMIVGALRRIYRAPRMLLVDIADLALESNQPAAAFAVFFLERCNALLPRTPPPGSL